MIGSTRRILSGIRIDRDALAVDLIGKVGPGKHFTDQKHTYDNFKKEMWYPDITNRKN
jgi:trimethylamine--corrinoid protein Co-methyltransferase